MSDTFRQRLQAQLAKPVVPDYTVSELTDMEGLSDGDRRLIERLRLAHEAHNKKTRSNDATGLDTLKIRTRPIR